MTKAKKKPSRLAKALLETAAGMHKSGLLDRAAYGKITLRHRGRARNMKAGKSGG
jgi:hypothetical protein